MAKWKRDCDRTPYARNLPTVDTGSVRESARGCDLAFCLSVLPHNQESTTTAKGGFFKISAGAFPESYRLALLVVEQ